MKQQSLQGLLRGLFGSAALLVMLALSPAATRASQISGTVNLQSNPGLFSKTTTDPNLVAIVGASSGSDNGFDTNAHGSVLAAPGYIKISGSVVDADSTVSGQFEDFFSITAPGIAANTPGILTFNVSVFGTLLPGTGATAGVVQWGMDASLGPTFNSPDLISVSAYQNNTGYVGNPFNIYSAQVPFLFGDQNSLDVRVGLSGSASGGSQGDPNNPGLTIAVGAVGFDLSHSLYWAGITDVTANGVPVSDFTAISPVTGANYANSFAPQDSGVPEPASLWLVAAAIPVAWLTRRRTSRTRPH